MGTIKTYTAYHATDKKNVQSIIDNNFTYNTHDDHWLGNGVYFFLDLALAEKWAKKPSKRFGEINNPEIIKAIIEDAEEYIIDMRNLEDYNYVKGAFEAFYKEICSQNVKLYDKDNKLYEKLRCAFFDWFFKKSNIHCIISYLNERNNLSNYTINGAIFNKFHTPYIEVQMCVPNNICIKTREKIIYAGREYKDEKEGNKH